MIKSALVEFEDIIQGKGVGITADNRSTLSYLMNEGTTHSAVITLEAQNILQWTEQKGTPHIQQFVRGGKNRVAD